MSFISGFCLLGVAIGVAALIVVMAIMNGFHNELTKNIIGLNGHITITTNADLEKIKNKLHKYQFVKNTGSLIQGQGLLVKNKFSSGVLAKGFKLKDLMHKKQLVDNVIFGDIKAIEENNSAIAIGNELALMLGVRLGDTIKLIAAQTNSTIIGIIPKAKEFTVAAIFNSGLYEYDIGTCITSYEIAQKIFTNTTPIIEIYTTNPDKVDEYSALLIKYLQNDLSSESYINNWQIMNKSILSALKIEKVAMITVLSLIVLVAAFNIISSLFMLVKDKTKDIAIMRTMGASKWHIMYIFILNGFLIGLSGTSIGLILGVLISKNINKIKQYLEYFSGIKIFDAAVYFLYHLPSQIQIYDVVCVCATSLFLCLLSTIYPAYRASKTNPVENLRYE